MSADDDVQHEVMAQKIYSLVISGHSYVSAQQKSVVILVLELLIKHKLLTEPAEAALVCVMDINVNDSSQT